MIYVHWELTNLLRSENIFFSEYDVETISSIEITVLLKSYLYNDLYYKKTFIFPKDSLFLKLKWIPISKEYWEIAYNKKKWIIEKIVEIEKKHNGENFINKENKDIINKIQKCLYFYDQNIFKELK